MGRGCESQRDQPGSEYLVRIPLSMQDGTAFEPVLSRGRKSRLQEKLSFSIENKKSYILAPGSSLIGLVRRLPKVRIRIKIRVTIIIRSG
jgi:hypothetical protein